MDNDVEKIPFVSQASVDIGVFNCFYVLVKNENPHMRIYNVLEWAVLINEGKPSICD